jgi:hypothetical protein
MPKGVYSRDFVPERFEREFWKKYEVKENGCWEWTALRSKLGYGRVCLWLGSKKHKYTSAHRVAWQLKNGEIPDGLFVCHSCDNPPCMNPSHLFLGTPKDNAQDSVRKGRLHFGNTNGAWTQPEKRPRGEDNGRHRYKDETLKSFLRDYLAGTAVRPLARKYGITYSHAYRIANGELRGYLLEQVKSECYII